MRISCYRTLGRHCDWEGSHCIPCRSNKYDPCAMAVYRKKKNVGHVPIELSPTLCFFVKYKGNILAKVRQETYQATNLELSDCKVPITVKCAIYVARKDNSCPYWKKMLGNAREILMILMKVSTTTQKESPSVIKYKHEHATATYGLFSFKELIGLPLQGAPPHPPPIYIRKTATAPGSPYSYTNSAWVL